MKPLIKPLSEGLSRQKTAAKSLLIPSGKPILPTHCRNQHIFNDRTGLAASRGEQPLPLHTYRRDMGGGIFVLMKGLSAPFFGKGRHWGG